MIADRETVAEACASGDPVRALVALRGLVADQLDVESDPRLVSSLSAELRRVLEAIELVEGKGSLEKVNSVDELAGKRNRRRAGAFKDGVSGSSV